MTGTDASTSLVVFTDLDGCLLDERTYSSAPAGEALERLRARRIPVVPCSSKTREEIDAIAADLDLHGPFVAENGGVVVIPVDHLPFEPPGATRVGDRLVLTFGVSRDRLVRSLAELAAETGVRVVGFAGLSADEVARLTGLDPAAAVRAERRECDEPFLILDGSPTGRQALGRAAAARGLRVTAGGRFLHLTGDIDKGQAVERLVAWNRRAGRRISSVGLGDAANDLPVLRVMDRPIVIPRADGTADASLVDALPRAECAPCPGPAGWNAAILAVLDGKRLPCVDGIAPRGGP
jgi:mannosyl-3-phosphoglycerate phosphatase